MGISSDIYNPSGGSSTTSLQVGGPGNVFSTIGDSEIALGTAINAGTGIADYVQLGAMTNARQFSGQRINYPIANNHAVGGTTWGSLSTQLPLALADNPDFIMVDWGTNDAVGGNTALALAKTNANSFMKQCFSSGATPVFMPVPCRSDAGNSTAVEQYIESWNHWIQDICAGRSDLINTNGLPLHKLPICLDVSGYPAYFATNGTSNPGMIGNDGLHKAWGGGIYDGYQIADIFSRMRPPAPTWYTSPYDLYDAANLINGNMMNFGGANLGMMQGTGGSLTTNGGITPTGQIAPHWQLVATTTISSSGTTAVAAKENPRTDGLISGERQRITLQSTGGGGGASEGFKFIFLNGNQGIRGSYTTGDIIQFEIRCQILSANNILGLTAQFSELGPATPQVFQDGTTNSGLTVGISSAAYPQMLTPIVFRTPPMTLQSGVTDLFGQINIAMYGAGTGYFFDAMFSDARVFHVVN